MPPVAVGTAAQGVRPFCSNARSHPDFYSYSPINIATIADAGLLIETAQGLEGELELQFQAPKKKQAVPWSGATSDDVKLWIEELTTDVDGQASLIRRDK